MSKEGKLSEKFMVFVGRCNSAYLTKFDIIKFNNETSAIANEIDKYEKQLTELKAENERLKKELNKEQDLYQYSRQSIWNLEDECVKLNKQIKEKDQQIHELQEQLKNAIVPKFKVGDKVYAIIDTMAYTDVFPVEIRDKHLLYGVWDGQDTTKQHSSRIFATQEEAENKLKELKESE